MTYEVGDIVIYRPRGEPDCYSPVVRPWAPWPSRHWHANHGTARPGDRMTVVMIDQVAGKQRLWYRSPYSPYGPAPEYARAGPGETCHNVRPEDVRLSSLSWIRRLLRRVWGTQPATTS
jgi:hypothetical protein